MKFVWNVFVSGCVLCAASAVNVLRADDRPNATGPTAAPNAAVIYWQAFSRMPVLTDEQRKTINEVAMSVNAPVTYNVTEIISQYEGSLRVLHRARNVAPCDWQLEEDSGPITLLLHMDKLRELSRVALLHARQKFAAGETDEAIDDVLIVYKMGRDCGASSVIISLLVSASVEKSATDLLVASLPMLNRTQLDQLGQTLQELPRTCDIASALRWEERSFCAWLKREIDAEDAKLNDPNAGRKLLERMNNNTGFNLEDRLNLNPENADDQRAISSLSSLSVADVRESINRLQADYVELVTIATLPYDQRAERFKQFDDILLEASKLKSRNDALRYFSITLLPSVVKILIREEQWDIRRQLLEQAIRVQRDGDDALQPILTRKVEYQKTSTGFELRCPCVTGMEVLTVGRPS